MDLIRLLVPGVALTRAHAEEYAQRWAEANELALRRTGPLWVALGDSMSQGVGASTFEGAWVNQAADRFRAAGRDYRVLNLSVTGATTQQVVDAQLPQLEGLPAPALVTVLVGANDMLRPSRRRGLEGRFGGMVSALPAGAYVARLPQPVPLAHRINAELERVAGRRGLRPVDMRPAVRRWRGHRAADLFHPNELGYARIAQQFVRAVLAVSRY